MVSVTFKRDREGTLPHQHVQSLHIKQNESHRKFSHQTLCCLNDSSLRWLHAPSRGQHLVRMQFLMQFVCLLVCSQWIFLVQNIGFPAEQCQTALWVFLIAHCVWLVFAIQC